MVPTSSLLSAESTDKCLCSVFVINDGYPVPQMIKVKKDKALHRPRLSTRSFEFYEAGHAAREDDNPVRHACRCGRNKFESLSVLLPDFFNQVLFNILFVLHKISPFACLRVLVSLAECKQVNGFFEVYIDIAI
jgi:hypothetical protein